MQPNKQAKQFSEKLGQLRNQKVKQ